MAWVDLHLVCKLSLYKAHVLSDREELPSSYLFKSRRFAHPIQRRGRKENMRDRCQLCFKAIGSQRSILVTSKHIGAIVPKCTDTCDWLHEWQMPHFSRAAATHATISVFGSKCWRPHRQQIQTDRQSTGCASGWPWSFCFATRPDDASRPLASPENWPSIYVRLISQNENDLTSISCSVRMCYCHSGARKKQFALTSYLARSLLLCLSLTPMERTTALATLKPYRLSTTGKAQAQAKSWNLHGGRLL